MFRHLLALGLLLVWGMFFIAIVVLEPADVRYRRTHPSTRINRAEKEAYDRFNAALAGAAVLIAIGGSVFFLIDATRRNYRGHHTLAIGLAILGVMSFGLISLIYYAIWGRFPLDRRADVFSTNFCARCLAATTERSAPDTGTHDLFLGSRLMGSADRCPVCKSVVRTLWIWIFLPLFPLGSYRIVTLDTTNYIGRRLHCLDKRQLISVYGTTLVMILLIAAIAIYAKQHP